MEGLRGIKHIMNVIRFVLKILTNPFYEDKCKLLDDQLSEKSFYCDELDNFIE